MDEHLTVVELSKYIKRTPGGIRNLVLRKKIPYRKPAGRLLFNRQEIDQWIEKSEGISLREIESSNGGLRDE
jgi:excisionase family DNA binding protein